MSTETNPIIASSKENASGYAIRAGNGYYEINGIGDWSLAGSPLTCQVFDSVAEAEECIVDNDLEDDDLEIVAITRTASADVRQRGEAV